jgi:Gram-negative porin
MNMFGGLRDTSSRIAIAAALGMTLGGFAMSSTPVKAADLGGDCCADLEERVAELEATTVRKGNKKVSVTLSGWVVELGTFWNDGKTSGLYWGGKDTTLSSHLNISGQATIAPGWTGGYTLWLETLGNSASAGFIENQFNDNAQLVGPGGINTLDSYMWIKSDKYGTVNWGRLTQASNNLALLPDLSGTIIESNAVLFDGAGFFLRPKGARNSNDMNADFTWLAVNNCLSGGGGVSADCPTGLDGNGVRYDSPTYAGFSISGGEYENTEWDIAAKYAADWGNFKVSAAYSYTENTDEGCNSNASIVPGGNCTFHAEAGGGGAPFQGFRKDIRSNQVGASAMHVPSGLFVYGLYQNEENHGTQFTNENIVLDTPRNSNANETNVWFGKVGIKRTWTPLGATVLWGEGGESRNEFGGLCGLPIAGDDDSCEAQIPTSINLDGTANTSNVQVKSSDVTRYGAGVVQEIDSAAMHVFFRWQHLNLDMSTICDGPTPGDGVGNCTVGNRTVALGSHFSPTFSGLDLFQVGGVIFF